MDNIQSQEDELLVLTSMFPDEFAKDSEFNKVSVINTFNN